MTETWGVVGGLVGLGGVGQKAPLYLTYAKDTGHPSLSERLSLLQEDQSCSDTSL